MTMNSNKKTAITKKEFRQMFTRSCTLDSAWNYERQQHINYCYMMIPVLKRLLPTFEKKHETRIKLNTTINPLIIFFFSTIIYINIQIIEKHTAK